VHQTVVLGQPGDSGSPVAGGPRVGPDCLAGGRVTPAHRGAASRRRGRIQLAPINADGTVGTWTTTTTFPTGRNGHTSVASDGFLYVIGGYRGQYLNDVQVAPINANGTVGAWTGTVALPTARASHTSVASNGYLYVIGGVGGTGLTNEVRVARLLTPSTRARYSKLVDFGLRVDSVDSVTINGSTAYRGLVSLAYRVAPESGIFGPLVDKGAVALGQAVALGDVDIKYLWLRLTLDDTQVAAINPDASNERDVTDIAVVFTSTPACEPCDEDESGAAGADVEPGQAPQPAPGGRAVPAMGRAGADADATAPMSGCRAGGSDEEHGPLLLAVAVALAALRPTRRRRRSSLRRSKSSRRRASRRAG
jgi:hypothetical protein